MPTDPKSEMLEKMKAMMPEEKCIFESDGQFHSCVQDCEGIIQNCKKCHRDICSNPNCPLGKGKRYNDSGGFNSCLSEVLAALPAMLDTMMEGKVVIDMETAKDILVQMKNMAEDAWPHNPNIKDWDTIQALNQAVLSASRPDTEPALNEKFDWDERLPKIKEAAKKVVECESESKP